MKRIWTASWIMFVMAVGVSLSVFADNPPQTPKPPCPCSASNGSGNNSVNLAVPCGPLVFGSVLDSVRMAIEEHTPSAMTATPQALHLDAGGYIMTSIRHITSTSTEVGILKGANTPMVFSFDGSSSIGYPIDDNVSAPERLQMVDANGNPVTSNPAYYDLLLENGDWYRFNSDAVSADSMDLNEVHVGGHTQTLADMGLDIVWDTSSGSKVLRQVRTPSRLFDIVEDISNGYSIHIYGNASVSGQDANGVYTLYSGATAFESWVIKNPVASNYNILDVIHQLGTTSRTIHYEYIPSNDEWDMSKDGGTTLNRYYHQSNSTAGTETYVREISNSGQINYKKVTVLSVYNWGTPVTSEQAFKNATDSITTTYTYYDVSTDNGYGKKKTMRRSDGYWENYIYDAHGRLLKKFVPWLDGAPTWAENTSAAKVIEYSYASNDPYDTVSDTDARPRCVIERVNGTEIKRTYYTYDINNSSFGREEIVKECTTPGAAYNNSGNLVTIRDYWAVNGSDLSGRLARIVYPDGREDDYNYDYGPGTYTTATGDSIPNAQWEQITHLGIGGAPLVNKTTRATKVYDQYGNLVQEETGVYTGSGYFENIGWKSYTYDPIYPGRLSDVTYSDGTQEHSAWGNSCCGRDSYTDRHGITTSYMYDDYGQVTSETRAGDANVADITTTYTYDGKGRKLSTTKTSADGTLSLGSSKTYDWMGRTTSATDEQGLTTSTTYSDDFNAINTRKESTTMPGGGTRIVERYRDGRVKSITGTAVVDTTYVYGFDTGLHWETIYTGPDGTSSPRWEKITSDMLNRTVSDERPGYGSGVTLKDTRVYDTAMVGKLSKIVKTVLPAGSGIADKTTLIEYDQMGNVYRKGLDIDNSGGLNPDSLDRITETVQQYIKDSGIWYSEQEVATYPENGVTPSPRVVTSVNRKQCTGLGGDVTGLGKLVSVSSREDAYGNKAVSSTYVDRSTATVSRKTVLPGSSTEQVTTTVNGHLMSATTTAAGAVTTYKYDGLGRSTTVSDPRTGDYTLHYNNLGQIEWTKDTALHQTSFGYDPNTGKRVSVTDPNNKATYFTYNLRGQKTGEYGSTYPVIYAYDDYGQKTDMYTYRGTDSSVDTPAEFANLTNSIDAATGDSTQMDRTQWNYDPATGLLLNKRYADGKGPDYDYYVDGKRYTRTWQRVIDGTSTRVMATYAYDSMTRELQKVEYNDGTPSVYYGDPADLDNRSNNANRDRLGRVRSVTDAEGTHAFVYTDEGALDTETITPAGGGGTIVIDRKQESSTSAVPGRNVGYELSIGGAVAQTIEYGYDQYGRFKSVDTDNDQATTPLVDYSYVNNSDLIGGYTASINGTYPQISVVKNYESNRDLVHSVVNSRIDTQGASPVTISSYTYTHDNTGRRTDRSDIRYGGWDAGNNSFGYNEHYEVNSVSMPVGDYGYTFDNIGNRLTSTDPIPGNGGTKGYESNELNQYAHAGSSFVSQYDDDGNLTTDGQWRYKWNAENRLAEMWTYRSDNVPLDGDKKLVFKYDYMGRRYSKDVYTYNSGAWVEQANHSFVYDGWNLIRDVSTDLTTSTISTKSYIWGLDLSQSLQQAGGTGGLLATIVDGSMYYALADANGNITDYVDSSGNLKAQYSYDAFGQVTANTAGTGQSPDTFSFRFSSTYQDLETGLNYYGFRYYSPALGRWLNRDPAEEDGGINLYAFIANDALDQWDVLGRKVCTSVSTSIVIGEKTFNFWKVQGSVSFSFEGEVKVCNDCTKELSGSLSGQASGQIDLTPPFFVSINGGVSGTFTATWDKDGFSGGDGSAKVSLSLGAGIQATDNIQLSVQGSGKTSWNVTASGDAGKVTFKGEGQAVELGIGVVLRIHVKWWELNHTLIEFSGEVGHAPDFQFTVPVSST